MYRTEFNRMIADAKAGKIDLIITKSVSRFARNVEHFLQAVHSLADHSPRMLIAYNAKNKYRLPIKKLYGNQRDEELDDEEGEDDADSM